MARYLHFFMAVMLVAVLSLGCAVEPPQPVKSLPARPIFHHIVPYDDPNGDRWYIVRSDEMEKLLSYAIELENIVKGQ